MNNNPLIVYSRISGKVRLEFLLESWLKNIRFHVWYLQSLLQKGIAKGLDVLMAISI